MIGSKDTTARGKPSFVHRVTKKAMSPIRIDWSCVKKLKDSAKKANPIRSANIIFFDWIICFDKLSPFDLISIYLFH